MRRSSAGNMALGGVLAALAVVVMTLGGLIPVATYVCPMICMILLWVVLSRAGSRVAWAWYAAVSILSLLLGPDKEAAAVFVFLGYYPIVKPWLDSRKLPWLWKLLLFQAAIGLMYLLLIHLFGMGDLGEEFQTLGVVMNIVLLILGNVTFVMFDRILTLVQRKHDCKNH